MIRLIANSQGFLTHISMQSLGIVQFLLVYLTIDGERPLTTWYLLPRTWILGCQEAVPTAKPIRGHPDFSVEDFSGLELVLLLFIHLHEAFDQSSAYLGSCMLYVSNPKILEPANAVQQSFLHIVRIACVGQRNRYRFVLFHVQLPT